MAIQPLTFQTGDDIMYKPKLNDWVQRTPYPLTNKEPFD